MHIASIVCLILVISFSPVPERLKTFHISGHAQGTDYQITYYSTDSLVSTTQIDSIFNRIDSSLSLYKSYSLINQFNRSSTGLKIDELFRVVVKKSIEIYRESEGMFDITVEPLVQAWGFGSKRIDVLPGTASLKSLLPCVGSDKLRISGDRLIKATSCVHVDVNGIAQGYSVDLLAEFLENKLIANYLVEVGGEIRVKGCKPSGEKMSIGIEGPPENHGSRFPIKKVIRLNKGAVTTSGNYRKYYEAGGKKIAHLINPKTGYPFQNELISVTVIAADAITADGFDNALMGLGLKKALVLAEKRKDIEAYFIYQTAGKIIADTATSGFYKIFNDSSYNEVFGRSGFTGR